MKEYNMNSYNIKHDKDRPIQISSKELKEDMDTFCTTATSPFEFKKGDQAHIVTLTYMSGNEKVKTDVVGIYPTVEYYSNMMLTIMAIVNWNKDFGNRPETFIRYPNEIEKFIKDQLYLIEWSLGDIIIEHTLLEVS